MSSSCIKEDFLQLIPVIDLSDKGLAKVIIDSLMLLGVNLEYMRGQGYDGSSAMGGKFNGVQSHIRNLYPLAVYVHCCSHSLNLAVSDDCTVAPIRNCMGTLGNISTFFSTSAKHIDALKQSIRAPLVCNSRVQQTDREARRHHCVFGFNGGSWWRPGDYFLVARHRNVIKSSPVNVCSNGKLKSSSCQSTFLAKSLPSICRWVGYCKPRSWICAKQ